MCTPIKTLQTRLKALKGPLVYLFVISAPWQKYEWVGSYLGESGRGGARLSEYLDDDGRLVMSKKELL